MAFRTSKALCLAAASPRRHLNIFAFVNRIAGRVAPEVPLSQKRQEQGTEAPTQECAAKRVLVAAITRDTVQEADANKGYEGPPRNSHSPENPGPDQQQKTPPLPPPTPKTVTAPFRLEEDNFLTGIGAMVTRMPAVDYIEATTFQHSKVDKRS